MLRDLVRVRVAGAGALRLETLLGSDRVGSPVPDNTYQPDQFHMTPFQEIPRPKTTPPQAVNTHLPLRRFRPPIPLHLTTRYDPRTGIFYPEKIISGKIRGQLQQLIGPWKLSGNWWEKNKRWTRREWDIQLKDGALYRIAYYNDKWFLEGVYG